MKCSLHNRPERSHAAEKFRIVSYIPQNEGLRESSIEQTPESEIKTEAFSGSFNFAPLISSSEDSACAPLRTADRSSIVKRTNHTSPKRSQPFAHQQAVNGIQIISGQDFQYGVSMLLVEPERLLVIHRDLK